MIITISEFENNLDKYLELSAEKDVYITKGGRKSRPISELWKEVDV